MLPAVLILSEVSGGIVFVVILAILVVGVLVAVTMAKGR
jgi:hypothetical protein